MDVPDKSSSLFVPCPARLGCRWQPSRPLASRARRAPRPRSTAATCPTPRARSAASSRTSALESTPWWPPRIVPPQAGAQRAAHHDRRRRVRRRRHLRRRHPDPGDGPHRAARDSATPSSIRRRSARRRARRSSPGATTTRSGFGVISEQSTGYPGYNCDHRSGQRHDRQHSARQRLRHLLVRQESQHPRASSPVSRRSVRSMAERDGLRVFLRVHGRRDQPVDALPVPRTRPRSTPGSASRGTT